jgi:hypothetical protein
VKLLFLDIETSPNVAFVWGIWNENIPIDRLIDAGYVLCWSAKWLGDRTIMFDSVHHSGSERMLEGIHKLLDEADVVVHYNGSKFDIPTLNKEFLQHGITPPSPYKQVDLLKTARRQFRFTSNKLDYVAQFLGLEGKKEHEGFQLWVKCMDGDEKAWRSMERYNKQDVRLLEQVYKKFLPWIKNHPNAGLFTEDKERPTCPVCGGHKLHSRGYSYTSTAVYQRFQCISCGAWSRNRLMEKEVRTGVLIRDG